MHTNILSEWGHSQITGPDDRVIYTGERESSGKYTFAAHIDGVYRYCFSNQMSSMTPKTVMFSMDVGNSPKDHTEGESKSMNIDWKCVASVFIVTL